MKNIILTVVLNVLLASISFGEETNKKKIHGQFQMNIKDMVVSSKSVQHGSNNLPPYARKTTAHKIEPYANDNVAKKHASPQWTYGYPWPWPRNDQPQQSRSSRGPGSKPRRPN